MCFSTIKTKISKVSQMYSSQILESILLSPKRCNNAYKTYKHLKFGGRKFYCICRSVKYVNQSAVGSLVFIACRTMLEVNAYIVNTAKLIQCKFLYW